MRYKEGEVVVATSDNTDEEVKVKILKVLPKYSVANYEYYLYADEDGYLNLLFVDDNEDTWVDPQIGITECLNVSEKTISKWAQTLGLKSPYKSYNESKEMKKDITKTNSKQVTEVKKLVEQIQKLTGKKVLFEDNSSIAIKGYLIQAKDSIQGGTEYITNAMSANPNFPYIKDLKEIRTALQQHMGTLYNIIKNGIPSNNQ